MSNLRFSVQSLVMWPDNILVCECTRSHPRTLHLAVLAHIRGFIRAFGSRVSLLVADAARAFEDTRLGAFGFGVTISSQHKTGLSMKNVPTPPHHN